MSKKVLCVDLDGKNYEIEKRELAFRPSVYAVIFGKDRVLLSKQWDGYDFPGGAIEKGEEIEPALIREVKEETGLQVKIISLINIYTSFFKLPDKNEFVHSLLLYYTASIVGGELSDKNFTREERGILSMPEWISLKDLQKIKFYNTVDSLEIIKKAKSK